MYQPTKYTERKLQLQITNGAVCMHDLACNCNEPAYHTLRILSKQLAGELTKQQKKQIQECLGIKDSTTTITEDAEDFGKELEELFAEDGENPTGAETG